MVDCQRVDGNLLWHQFQAELLLHGGENVGEVGEAGVVDVGAGCGAMLRIDVEHALVSGLVDHRLIDFPLDQLGQMLRTTDLVLLHP